MADQLPNASAPATTPENAPVTQTAPVSPPVPVPVPPTPDVPVPPSPPGLGINFIRDQRKKLDAHLELDKKVARYTMAGLAVFIVVMIVVMSVYFLLTLEQKKIDDATVVAQGRLTGLSTLEKEYVVYAKKIKLLFALDSERKTKRDATNFFYALVPNVNVLREIRTDDEKAKESISFTIDSPDVFAALDLLKRFGDTSVIDKGYIITIQALSRSNDGIYTMNGNMDYARASQIQQSGAAK